MRFDTHAPGVINYSFLTEQLKVSNSNGNPGPGCSTIITSINAALDRLTPSWLCNTVGLESYCVTAPKLYCAGGAKNLVSSVQHHNGILSTYRERYTHTHAHTHTATPPPPHQTTTTTVRQYLSLGQQHYTHAHASELTRARL